MYGVGVELTPPPYCAGVKPAPVPYCGGVNMGLGCCTPELPLGTGWLGWGGGTEEGAECTTLVPDMGTGPISAVVLTEPGGTISLAVCCAADREEEGGEGSLMMFS